jgi:transposase
MTNPSQKRALKSYRNRLQSLGIARFEVLGLEIDRDLIRSLAKQLTQNDSEARRLRSEIKRNLSGDSRRRGGLLAVLQLPALEGLELEITRPLDPGRDVTL